MFSRSGKFYLAVLIASSMAGGLLAAEDSHDDLSAVDKVTGDDRTVKIGNRSDAVVVERNSTATSRQKGRSVKMIVGGQSTDGLAKEVSLPVGD